MQRAFLSCLVAVCLCARVAMAQSPTVPSLSLPPRPWGPVAALRPGMTVAEATRIAPRLMAARDRRVTLDDTNFSVELETDEFGKRVIKRLRISGVAAGRVASTWGTPRIVDQRYDTKISAWLDETTGWHVANQGDRRDMDLWFERYQPAHERLGAGGQLPFEDVFPLGTAVERALGNSAPWRARDTASRFRVALATLRGECESTLQGTEIEVWSIWPKRRLPRRITGYDITVGICPALTEADLVALLSKKWGVPTKRDGIYEWTRSDGARVRMSVMYHRIVYVPARGPIKPDPDFGWASISVHTPALTMEGWQAWYDSQAR